MTNKTKKIIRYLALLLVVILIFVSVFFLSPYITLLGFLVIIVIITIYFRKVIRDFKKSEQKYQSLIDNVSGAIYSQKIDDRKIIFLSERFKEITGYSPQFFSGEKKIYDIIHPEDWARVKMILDERIKAKGSWDIEYRIVAANEELRWVNDKGRVILNGNREFIEGIFIDITKQKAIEETLRESEERYKNLVERANDGIVIVQNGKIKYTNPSFLRMLGYSDDEVVETDFEKYVIEEEKSKFLARYNDNTLLIYETVLSDINGRKVYIEMSSGFINYKGELADLLIIRDITQRRQIEEILHQREQEFRNLVERAPDIIARFDKNYRYTYINPAIKKEMGIHPRDFFWKTFRDMGMSDDVAQIWEEALDTVFATGKEKTIYTEQDTLNGKRYYYTRLLLELNKNGEPRTVLSISRDITETREIDKVKSEFISVSSHQLRTPLSVIKWCTVMFLDGMLGDITKEQKGYLEKIYKSTRKLIKISNTLFNAAVLDLGLLNVVPKKINLIELAKESIEDINKERKEKEMKISEEYGVDLPLVKVDKRILCMIFKGLLSNAVKYGYKGGNVWLDIKKQGSDIIIKVSDDGRGIPKKEQSKIFTKFFRAENVKNEELYGIGLDLYIIKEIITNFGGTIWFESPNPDIGNKGTAFYFTIPLSGMKEKEGKKVIID